MTLPSVPAAFRWTREPWGAALRCIPLEVVAGHLFSSRQLPFTEPGGERQLLESLGAAQLAQLTQVHGNRVVVVDEAVPARATEGDALASRRHDVALAVRSADCVPLLLADRVGGAVAAVHGGWRGTAAGIARAAVDTLVRELGVRPRDIVAAIGPAIASCCYEVGPELVDAFAAAGHGRDLVDRWFVAKPPPRGSREKPSLRLDLPGATRDQLVLAGVPEAQIHMSGLCTAMHLDVLTSWRAERGGAGRIAAVIRSPPAPPAA